MHDPNENLLHITMQMYQCVLQRVMSRAQVTDCIITHHYGTDIKTKLTFVRNQVLRGFYASALRYFSRLRTEKVSFLSYLYFLIRHSHKDLTY